MCDRKYLRGAVAAIALVAQLAILSVNLQVSVAASAQNQVAGRWQGKLPLPDDNSVADADNPVAVELTIKDDGGKLSGSVIFYVIRNKDNKPQVVGKKESELIAPQFDGKTLKFGLKSKGSQPGTETTIDMRMILKSENEAELENTGDSSAAVIKMKKVH